MDQKAPLFKGATRPACVWGIPIKPFLGCVGVHILLAFWFYVPLLLFCVPSLMIMHRIAKEDDQRFRQLFLHFKTNVLGARNKQYWQGVSSFASTSYKKAKGVGASLHKH